MSIDRNSLVSHLTGYARALFKDCAWAYLSYSDCERDISRLSHELARKGSRILTLDMPALGKHFDKCLDRGLYKPSKLYLGRVPKKGPQVPVFLRDLYLQVFDHQGELRSTPNPEVVFLLRTLFMSAKKLRLPFSDRSLRSEVKAFLRIEQEIIRPTLAWDEDDLFRGTPPRLSDVQSGRRGSMEGGEWVARPGSHLGVNLARDWPLHGDEGDREIGLFNLLDPRFVPEADGRNPYRVTTSGLDIVQQVADRIVSQFGDLFEYRPHELPKHGPGAVAEGSKHTNKYAFPNWPRKLQATFPADYFGSPRLGDPLEFEGEFGWGPHEAPSRLIAVPKTQKGPRLIAAEPIAHQWIQQLVKNQLEGRLADTPLRHCISFRDQSLSGAMALRGSVDGSFTTIDLSSASDRLSCWLVERVFRSNIPALQSFHACRTRWLTYRNDRDQVEYIRLNKFAPMGSAVTFPVQSIIYAIVAIACLLIQDELKPTSRSIEAAARQVRVFGDDIIIPRRAHRYTVRYLEGLGLRTNLDKTFEDGYFRESCGTDAWKGNDVTPPYLRAAEAVSDVTALGSALAVRNNYYRKGFWNVAYWLDAQMSRWERFLPDIPAMSHTAGRASFLGANDSLCQTRYNEKWHREEVRVLLPYRKTYRGSSAAAHRLFQWFIEEPLPEIHWTSGWTMVEVLKTRPGWVPRDFISSIPQGTQEL